MSEVLDLDGLTADRAQSAVEVLERGGLVRLPGLPFHLAADERDLLDPAVLDPKSKNVSYDPAREAVGGVDGREGLRARFSSLLKRYAEHADAVIAALAPAYRPALQRRRTSFRPGAIATRALSARKDDTRLHVDAFPSNPTQGRRILRVFSNVNPDGVDRCWRIGAADFETFAGAFKSRVRPRDVGPLTQWLGLTRGRRTPYDDLMLKLHDAAKLDEDFQRSADALDVRFAPGSTWVVYTDSVLHAAMTGQHAFEQTYLLPISAMASPERAPLRVLEGLFGRRLA